MNKPIVLFMGRFQPLHNGHLLILKKIAPQARLIKIGIGSAQYSHTAKNPLSAAERRSMVKKTLQAARIRNFKIYLVPDVHDNALWVAHVKKIVGKFNLVYSGNPLVIRLFREKHIPVKRIRPIPPYSATKIRALICKNKSIKKYVPSAVLTYLKKVNALQRVKKLCK